MNGKFKLACVLFDLDGTLVDTAPDLVACLNRAIGKHGYPSFEVEQIRAYISYGAAAMIAWATKGAGEDLQKQMLTDMLNDYQNNLVAHSRFFAGMPEALSFIENQGLKWGVVTNKRERFTLPLMTALKLTERAACIVSGDTTANSKPHPEPMLAACRQANVKPENCVYIGDAAHDITAGKCANMKTLAALYGYLKNDDQPDAWGADGLISSPEQLTSWIQSSACY
ncbi:HAD-IA family hydrolase [Methylomarinum sp. Ch1-1]|uniref:HAD-IA family hydrolase n=1 Tax=Methylomarinum roseum TaxID=3067653 RepID=A0AAU7NTM2_9GAMM|nr:HAD-IA family hydrolase [Methylomarinum sp. Ch1-1]MDP4520004.1 HAD-IA family hydrolase [Methylomarinum sp. Ch1-1]